MRGDVRQRTKLLAMFTTLFAGSVAVGQVVIYQEDFSSDPLR
jgi:hypothetical protein